LCTVTGAGSSAAKSLSGISVIGAHNPGAAFGYRRAAAPLASRSASTDRYWPWLLLSSPRPQRSATLLLNRRRDRAARERGENAPEADANPEPPLVFINLGALQDQPVPEDEWFVLRRIPCGNVTLLSGDGGTGKTSLALMLCTTAPFGGDWLGSIVDRPGPSMFVTGEETEKKIHKRLARVLAHQNRDVRDIAGKVYLHCRPLEDPTLERPDRYGTIQPTNFFKRVVEAAHDTKPSLIFLEAAADLFGRYPD